MARKILLADDSVTAQNMGRKILADAGYEVITVNNGSAALKKIGEQHPDVIVLDVYMPGYSGLEVCQRLKEVTETSRIPILLTVGKLEPFKPEEVKRVRADGFIVKPFEASELLSALSKLEDRIVPRSEPSKPGRFARATAALEEGRYDKTVAIEEDSSWKNRISFPSKKKEREKEAEPEEPAAYSSGNKDLRTVIEHKLGETPTNGKQEERVDLGALAPAGLPKDVTPEEIAALAAAAARIQGKIAEPKIPDAAPEISATPAVDLAQPGSQKKAGSEGEPEVAAPASTFAEQNGTEQETKAAEAPVMASSPAQESHSASAEPRTDEPITMAVGGATPEVRHSHWTAVSVALAPEDAAISLEQEMQKAYAAFAAAETGHAGNVPGTGESGSPAPHPSPIPAETVAPEPVLPVPASAAPEAAQTLSAVAGAATDIMSAAAEQLQAVASSYVEQKETTPASADEPSIPSVAVEAVAEQKEQVAASSQETIQDDKPKTEDQPQPVAKPWSIEKSHESAPHPDVLAPNEISTGAAPASVSESATPAPSAEPAIERESDRVAATAAAWTSWRSSQDSSGSSGTASPQDMAAKAVAAGAESHAEVASEAGSDPSIASIVDSVLADLRPKIVEEISRKLGKKK